MTHLKKILFGFEVPVFTFMILFSVAAMAQNVISPQDFLNQVLTFIQGWGGLATVLKISGLVTLLISSMNVTILNQLVWDKIPDAWKPWVAPLLGLLAGILGLGQNGPITPASIFAWVFAGSGAIVVHELLDMVKDLPGVGWLLKGAISLLETFLNGPSSMHPSAIAYRNRKADKLEKQVKNLLKG